MVNSHSLPVQSDRLDMSAVTPVFYQSALYFWHALSPKTRHADLLLALCAGWGSVAFVDSVLDADAEGLIAVSGQQSPGLSQQAEVVIESVPLLNPILEEKTVTQSVITYGVLHLGQRKKHRH